MNVKQLFIVLFSLFIILGCSEDKPKKDSIKSIIINYDSKRINLSDVIEKITYIPLETTSECLMGTINKMIYYESKFYLLDSYNAKALFIFNKDGKFIQKILATGKGPGEFQVPSDFIIYKINRTIQILDNGLRKILLYNLHGKYISTKRYDFFADSFGLIDNNHYCFTTGNIYSPKFDGQLIIADSLLSFIKNYLPIQKAFRNFSYGKQLKLRNINRGLYFFPNFENTIYKVNTDGIDPYLIIDFGKYQLPINFRSREMNRGEKIKYLERANISYDIDNFCETKKFIFFNFNYKKQNFVNFYSKQSKNIRGGYQTVNGINYMPLGRNFTTIGSKLASVIDPNLVIQIKNSLPIQYRSKLPTFVKGLNDLSNQIIAIYDIKEF